MTQQMPKHVVRIKTSFLFSRTNIFAFIISVFISFINPIHDFLVSLGPFWHVMIVSFPLMYRHYICAFILAPYLMIRSVFLKDFWE